MQRARLCKAQGQGLGTGQGKLFPSPVPTPQALNGSLWQQEQQQSSQPLPGSCSSPHVPQTGINPVSRLHKEQGRGDSCQLSACTAPFPRIISNNGNFPPLERFWARPKKQEFCKLLQNMWNKYYLQLPVLLQFKECYLSRLSERSSLTLPQVSENAYQKEQLPWLDYRNINETIIKLSEFYSQLCPTLTLGTLRSLVCQSLS